MSDKPAPSAPSMPQPSNLAYLLYDLICEVSLSREGIINDETLADGSMPCCHAGSNTASRWSLGGRARRRESPPSDTAAVETARRELTS